MPKDHTYRYDFSVIEQYLKGELSPAEMHELERAALSDPFLADALEGYQLADLHKSRTDLSDIRKKISGNETKGQIIPFKRSGVKWWQIAALFILLAGLATSIWKFNQPDSSPTLISASTYKKDTVKNSFTPGPEVSGKDTQKSLAQAAKTNALIAQAPPTPVRENEQHATVLTDTYSNKLQEAATISANAQKKALTDSMMAIELMRSSAGILRKRTEINQELNGKVAGVKINPAPQPFILKGKVVDSMQKPLSYATVQLNTSGLQKATMTSADGSFQITSKDSVVNATISALGHQSATLNLSAAKSTLVSLTQGSEALNEVVVVGYAPERKTSFTGSVRKESVIKDSINIQPDGGIDAFILSIKQQWQAKKWDTTDLKGPIECILSFDNKGHISKVRFTKSYRRSFKKKLTTLLKTSPPWKKTGTVLTTDHTVILFF